MGIQPKLHTVAEQWEWFALLVMPKDAPPIQVTECRRAFYAGFESALRVNWSIGDPGMSEDAGVAILEGLVQECTLFAQRIARGEA